MVAGTKLNGKSSRSHSIFRIHIETLEENTQTGRRLMKASQMNLVDLAGSEGASKAESAGRRLGEG